MAEDGHTVTPDEQWEAVQQEATEAELRRDLAAQTLIAEQLQAALDTRVIIEQAVGVLAERHHVDVGASFELLRRTARSRNLRLRELAAAVVADVGGKEKT